jgi:vancomycin resistance protein VanJ
VNEPSSTDPLDQPLRTRTPALFRRNHRRRSSRRRGHSQLRSPRELVTIFSAFIWLKRLFIMAGMFISAALVWLGLCLEIDTEHNLFLTTLSYLPIWVPLLPVLFVLPILLFFSRLHASILALGAACYFFMHVLTHYGSGQATPTAPLTALDNFRVMSFNVGQSHHVDFVRLLEEMKPDIILLQEARGWLKRKDLSPELVPFPFREEKGEFAILSKHPLQESGPPVVSMAVNGREKTCAYRHRMLVFGRRVTVFNVHMPSPRDLLKWNAGGACMLGLIHWTSPGISDLHQQRTLPWRDRAYALGQIASLVEHEPNLVVVGGDLNCPPWGGGYRALCRSLKDCFAEAGHGFGTTFPGDFAWLPDFISPWVRLDHLLVSKDAHVQEWRQMRSGQMQHLPVCAEIHPQG